MAKKKDKQGPTATDTVRAIKRRAVAAKAFYTGEIAQLYSEQIAHGASPWQVLQYKRVVLPEELPFPLSQETYVRPSTFEAHLKYISRECKPIALRTLLEMIEQNQAIPERTVALTFDGGHTDNYLHAFPLLLKYSIPATFFIPTGYIESNSFFYEDRILMSLLVLKEKGLFMPKIEVLDESIYDTLSSMSDSPEITLDKIKVFIDALSDQSQRTRTIVMGCLAEAVSEITELPDHEDFMRWDDLRHITEMGFDVASMGHWVPANPNISATDFPKDLDLSLQTLKEEGITPLENIIGSNPLRHAEEIHHELAKHGLRYCLADSFVAEPKYQSKLPMVIGRRPMFEAVSHSKELFACRLWDLEISGVKF